MANNNDLRRRLAYVQALLETIAETGDEGAPSGICYMAMQMHGIDINTYQSMVDGLVRAGLITNKAHVLRTTAKAKALMTPLPVRD